jgi:hypothetical protein
MLSCSRQNGPVALSEEAINELPFHTLTSEELGMYSLPTAVTGHLRKHLYPKKRHRLIVFV